MTDWKNTQLGDVLTLQRGFDLPLQNRKVGQVPIVASTGIVGSHNEQKVTGPGVVIGRSGSIGGGQFISKDFWPLNTTLWVKDFKGNDVQYCFYLIKNIDFSTYNVGSGVPTLNRNHVHPHPVFLAPLAEQKAIASVLGALDDKIENNRQMNETLEQMARAIFKSWFVDFDPVHAKAAGKKPARMDAATAALFPDSFGENGLPMGWEESTIGDEVQIFGGGTPSTKEPAYWENGNFYWCTPKDLSPLVSPVLLGTDRKITASGLKKISSGLLPIGTLLMSSRAPVGYLAISQVPTAVNQGFIAMKCNQKLSNFYTLFWCKHNMDKIQGNAGGTVFAEISKKSFKPISVICPDVQVLSAFDLYIEAMLSKIVSNLKENQTLAELRDILLPKLMSGEIRIKDAEREVGKSV